jgi:hypothetical protein
VASDKELIAAFLEVTDDYSLREAARAIAVAHGTVQRWRSGEWKKLHPDTKRAIEYFLNDRGPEGESMLVALRRAVSDKGLRHVAQAMGVREGLVRDYIDLEGRVGRDIRQQIRDGFNEAGIWLWYGGRETLEETPESAVYDPHEGAEEEPPVGEAEIVAMPQVVKHLKTFEGRPDAAMLKLAAVRVWGEILALSGGWPDWYVAVKGKVERGEL